MVVTSKECEKKIDAIKGCLFDMDGVIINGMPFHAKAWQMAFAEIGLSISEREVYEREGESGQAAVALFLAKRGVTLTSQSLKALMDRKEMLFKQIVDAKPFAGVNELLDKLITNQKKIALVTGTARHELNHSLPDHLQQKFGFIITGDEVKQGKPAAEPYQRALDKLQLKPDEVIVIENAPLGIQSAKQAGCCCYALTTSLPAAYLQEADRCFNTIADLDHYLFGAVN
jgi:beta-phosphoglucomutase